DAAVPLEGEALPGLVVAPRGVVEAEQDHDQDRQDQPGDDQPRVRVEDAVARDPASPRHGRLAVGRFDAALDGLRHRVATFMTSSVPSARAYANTPISRTAMSTKDRADAAGTRG